MNARRPVTTQEAQPSDPATPALPTPDTEPHAASRGTSMETAVILLGIGVLIGLMIASVLTDGVVP